MKHHFCSHQCHSNFRKGKTVFNSGSFAKGQSPWNKGKKGVQKGAKWSEQARIRMKENQTGEGNSNWKGGSSGLMKTLQMSRDWALWREDVFKRDDYACRVCGSKEHIEPHHIIPKTMRLDLIFEVSNGLTLCKECHKQLHHLYGGVKNQVKFREALKGVTVSQAQYYLGKVQRLYGLAERQEKVQSLQ